MDQFSRYFLFFCNVMKSNTGMRLFWVCWNSSFLKLLPVSCFLIFLRKYEDGKNKDRKFWRIGRVRINCLHFVNCEGASKIVKRFWLPEEKVTKWNCKICEVKMQSCKVFYMQHWNHSCDQEIIVKYIL